MDQQSNKPIDLSLDPGNDTNLNAHVTPEKPPVMGWFAVGFGALGIFTLSIVFVPLALVCAIIAMFMGQFIWAMFGVLLAIIGFLTSPQLLLIAGLGILAAYFGI